jgi:hypothetical protein
MQTVLSFRGTSSAKLKLCNGFLDMFDMHIQLCHGKGAMHIDDAQNGQSGFTVQYFDRSDPVRFPGLCWTIKRVFCARDEWISGNKGKQKGAGTSTKMTGLRIHRHVFHQVECMRSGDCTCIPRTPNTANPQASRLLQVVKDKGWIPVRAELGIVSHTIGVATRVDLVCFDPDPQVERFVLVSWKTGYKNIVTQMTGPSSSNGPNESMMKAPLDTVPDNERSRNQLQLLCEYLILTKEYSLDLAQALIVYIRVSEEDENRVIIDTAAPWWWNKPDLCNAVWDHLKDRNHGGPVR